MKRSIWICLVLLAAGPLFGDPGAPSYGELARARGAQPEAPVVVSQPLELFSSFWINLHHVLHSRARGRGPTPLACRTTTDEAGQKAWADAVAFYQQGPAQRHVLFDQDMTRAKNALAEMGSNPFPPIAGGGIPQGMASALKLAAPEYRRCGWPEHDRTNRQWIRAVEPKLQQHGNDIARRLTELYGTPWPAPIRVDVSVYGGRSGAFTTSQPPHVVISSYDAGYQGYGALEMLFHESSHTLGRLGAVGDAIKTTYDALGEKQPQRLWHAVLFWNAGEVTRQVLAAAGIEYQPYADAQNLYDSADWAAYRDALAKHWSVSLTEQKARDAAMAKVVKALSKPSQAGDS